MTESRNLFRNQLRDACRTTGARWAAWFERTASDWELILDYAVTKARLRGIEDFIQKSSNSHWLAGGLSSGRVRSRATKSLASQLGCERLYVFPNPQMHSVLLVGTDQMEKAEISLFRILCLGIPFTGLGDFSDEAHSLYASLDIGSEFSYNLPEALEHVIRAVASYLPSTGGYVAIRQGDIFRIESGWNMERNSLGLQVSTDENPLLERLATTGTAQILKSLQLAGDLSPPGAFVEKPQSWMGVPLVLGKRVIGLFVFVSNHRGAFSESDLRRATILAQQVAPIVENAIAFAEAQRYLQRLALLNELASAASAGLEIDKVASRVLRMLRRTFHTEHVALLLLSSDKAMLREYGEESGKSTGLGVAVADSLADSVVKSGMPVRVDDRHDGDRQDGQGQTVCSEMAVPLKYRGNVIGVLTLASQEPNAFSLEDQQLLVVIASHLASLIENVRLSEETRDRARNIDLIHQVVQKVVGLTDLQRVAQLSAELMAERFSYELAVVLVFDRKGSAVSHLGVGGTMADQAQRKTWLPIDGVIGQVLETGENYLSNDVSQEPIYEPIRGWHAGSLMCVPLREGDRVIGAINVERSERYGFTENDLIVLESLAGFLSSVMMNARRYQQLQSNVRHMQAARETALDISTDLDLEILLRRVVHRVKELVDVKGVELGMVDETEQVVRVLVSENLPGRKRQQTIPMMADVAGRVAALGEPLIVNDYRSWSGKLSSGKKTPFTSVAGVPLIYKGEVIGTLTVFDDKTDRVFRSEDVQLLELLAPQVAVSIRNARLYQELGERIEAHQLAESRLIQSARLAAVGEMAAGVAHELNNPLTTVTGFAELILEEIEGEFPQRPDVELILKEAKRARGVVRRLLDFSRQSESVKERTEINPIVTDVVAMVRHLARTGGVEIQLDLGENLPLVYIDRNHMKQVLLNLVHNALQAMPTGGNLMIGTSMQTKDDEDWVTMSVKDTGEGISSQYLGRIFEPFFTTKPTGSGTGLGLAISYGIVSDHGGFVDVESHVGVGSCFTIWLPQVEDHVGSP